MAELIRRADARWLNVVDSVVLFWLVLWTAVGCWVGFSLWHLAGVGDTLVQSGQTLDTAGQALQRVGDIPLIGQWPDRLGAEVRATAVEIIGRGRETALYGQRLAVLLGLTVGLVAIVPILAPYLPARITRRREVAAIRRMAGDPSRRPLLDFYLAHRAMGSMPLHRLERMAGHAGALSEERLAEAELGRLGLHR
ncbi:hypothetical protein [Actinoplanes sp. NPDC051411]|uniref:hypothetical protein n=1 Tax=Actinoplanes sp. NPDC051411 TaxID=3155522 RepID=UPI0034209F28